MHKKKIIIFLTQPIDERNIQRFGYKLLKKNFDVKFCNISDVFNKNIIKAYKKNYINNPTDNKNFFEFNSYFQIFNLLKDCKKAYFVDSTTYKTVFFSLLQQYAILNKLKKIHITSCFLPKEIFASKKEKLAYFFKKKNFLRKNIVKFIFNYLKVKFVNILSPAPNFAFIAGLKEVNSYPKRTRILLSHCFDYDLFLKENEKKLLLSKNKFALFIDSLTFDHPELSFKKNNKKNPFEKKYYADLKIFFYNIHKEFNINITIALHPRSNIHYKKKINKIFTEKYFLIIDNDTPKYIKNSSLVISHNSSAIQLAILWKKPIIFCHHNKMNNYIKTYVSGLASALKKKSYDIENNKFTILKKDFNVIDKNYKNYTKNYIQSSPKSKISSWDKFSSMFKN